MIMNGVGCGMGHTLYIAKDEDEEDKKLISKLPEWTLEQVKAAEAEAAEAAAMKAEQVELVGEQPAAKKQKT